MLVEPEKIHRCLESIRPYHALLLLVDRDELSNSFSVDASSTIPRLLQVYSPMKSLQVIAADADLTLSQAVEVASHLVYWAVATLIYPLCETNVYVIAPDAPIPSQEMEEAFLNSFPGLSLTETLADFSLAMPLGERANPVLGMHAYFVINRMGFSEKFKNPEKHFFPLTSALEVTYPEHKFRIESEFESNRFTRSRPSTKHGLGV